MMPKRICLGDEAVGVRNQWPQVSFRKVTLTPAVALGLQLWNRTLMARNHWAPVSSHRVMLTLAAAAELQRHRAQHPASQHEKWVTSLQLMPTLVCLGGAQKAFHNQMLQRNSPLQMSDAAELQLQHMMGLATLKLSTTPCLGDAQIHVRGNWEQASH